MQLASCLECAALLCSICQAISREPPTRLPVNGSDQPQRRGVDHCCPTACQVCVQKSVNAWVFPAVC